MRRWQMLIAGAAMSSGFNAVQADELRDYGKYLAGECTICHRLDGAGGGIPSIIGMDAESFTKVLKAYQSGALTNQTMVSVAKSLDENQIKALAAFFSSIKPRD